MSKKKKKFTGVQFVESVRAGKRTFAFGIYYDVKIGKIPFAGLAEKNPKDHENTIRGRNLAIGRAFETLGKEIEKREWHKLKSATENRVRKHTLTTKEIFALKNAPEAVIKRDARAKKRDSTKAGGKSRKKNKVGEA